MSTLAGVARRLMRAPGYSLAVAATLALGVGAATALFVYLSSFFRPVIPAVDTQRLVQVHFGTDDDPTANSSLVEYRAIGESAAFPAVAANYASAATVEANGNSEFAWGQAVTSSFFRIFGGRALHGRLLVAADDSPHGEPPAVLSNRLWRTCFAADPKVVGRSIELNGRRFTVVGVLARGFQATGYAAEWFVPLREIDHLSGVARLDDPREKFLFVWALLPPDRAAHERVAGVLDGVARGLDAEAPLGDAHRRQPLVVPATLFGPNFREDPYYRAARALTAATLLFLLLGAGNVSGLLLARATARDREWAVRKAMGASPARLAATIVGEAVPLILLGLLGALGIAFAVLVRIESALFSSIGGLGPNWTVEDANALRLDGRAVLFAFAAGLVALVIGATPPLLRVLRRDPAGALRSDGARGGADRRVLAPRRLLVGFEMALAVVLLVGGLLLARTLGAYADADPGFDSRGLALVTVYLPPTAGDPGAGTEFYRDLVARAGEIAGVSSATVAFAGPNTGFSPRQAKAAPVDRLDAGLEANYNVVSPAYLATLGVPIVAGRDLSTSDLPDSSPAVVVSAALAEKLWGSVAGAVGQRLRLELPVRPGQAGPEFEVVGVSADAGVTSPAEPDRPWVFFAYGQRTFARMQLILRTALPLAVLEPQLREVVAGVRADASIIDLVSAEQQLHSALQSPRLNAQIAGGLALAGLATALVGLVALQLFTVSLRRRDFAVRMALGATRQQVSGLVLGESLRIAGFGAVVGLVAAAASARWLGSVLYGVSAFDPWSFLGVPLALVAVVLVAGWWPARRAAEVDPAENLRSL